LTRGLGAAILRDDSGAPVGQLSLRGVTKVVKPAVASLILCATLVVAGCGGSTPAASGSGAVATSQPSSSLAGTEPPVSAKPGKPVVTVDGQKVHVEGIGVGISEKFTLTGNMAMAITPCKSTGTTPFIVLRSAKTNLAPTYVDPVTHLTGLDGQYDVEITPAPTCAWAVDFTPE
jgi:hypothetical protein